MTLILFIVGTALFAQTLLLGAILFELREARMTRDLRGSVRRGWVRKEHTDG